MATTYASEYDPLSTSGYDPQFTANISNRMQVPDSIHVGGHSQSPMHSLSDSPRAKMNVPERILLAGDNQHIGLKEEYRSVDQSFESPSQAHVGLSTPPRILKIEDSLPEETPRPLRDPDHVRPERVPESRHERSFLNGLVSMDTSYRSVTPPLPLSVELMADESLIGQDEDDVTVVRHHVSRLQRHVVRLEEDNDLRSRREMILYPTLLIYFLFQVGKWFFGRR